MFEEFYEMYETEEQEVVALINRCIGGGYNNKGGFWQMTVVTLGMVFCDTGKVSTKEERLDWPVTEEERNSDKGWGRFGFSDVLTVFLAMDSYVELYKGGIIPLKEYAKMPYDRDILVRLIVKKEKAAFDYQSVRNSQTDFPVLTCAAAKTEAGYRFSIGARPGKAVLFELADADIQAADVENMAENAAKCVKEQVETGSNTRGSAEYRKHLAGVLVRRAVCKLAGK